jgi:hypothetical protein
MEKDLLPLAQRIIKEHHIDIAPSADSEAIFQKIAFHIDALVHNVVSTAALVAMMHNESKIDSEHLKPVKIYIESQCMSKTQQRGGTSMASDFFGYPHPNYSESHENSGVAVSKVDFAQGVARPALSPAQGMFVGGGTYHESKEIKAAAKTLLKSKNVSIGKKAFTELLRIIDSHIHCFANDMKKKCPLTVSKLDKILHTKRHAVFH